MTDLTTNDLNALSAELLKKVADAADEAALEQLRVETLGKKGVITLRMASLGQVDPAKRREVGQANNELKNAVAQAIAERQAVLGNAARAARLAAERIDVTLPVFPEAEGHIHPISQTIEEITQIFAEMGFT